MSSNHRDIENLLRSQMDVGSTHIEHVHTEPRKRTHIEESETMPDEIHGTTLFERVRGKLALRQTITIDDDIKG